MQEFEAKSVQTDEILSRYIFDKSHYRTSDNAIRYTAFMPPSDDLRVSVFRIAGLAELEIWSIGESVGQVSNRMLHGRGDITADVVWDQKLDIKPDNQPPRHANITGWPGEKHERQLIAQVLAAKAKLKLR